MPAGSSDGGQWTDGDVESLIIAQSVPRRPGGGGTRRIGGRWTDANPAQATRLEISHAQMQAAIRQVRKIDPAWKPRPSLYETIEGAIAANEAATREAQARLRELQTVGIGPGSFAVESQPARSPARNWTKSEIRENNRIGREYGCHTCGTMQPGTRSGNFFVDHQLPNAWNPSGGPQRLFPHCATCSARQGNWIWRNKRK